MVDTTKTGTAGPAKSAGWILTGLLILAANYGIDRLAKIAAIAFLKGHPPIHFFGDLMVLVYAENAGAFLGMGGSWPYIAKLALLVVLPLAACVVGTVWALKPGTRRATAAAALCIIGGGLGNLQDRLFNDFRVVDFLNFGIGPVFRTGILNIGDLSVTFGAIALIAFESFRSAGKDTPPGSR